MTGLAPGILAKIDHLPIAPDLLVPYKPRKFVHAGIYTVAWDDPDQVQLDFDFFSTDRRTGETHAELTVYLTDEAEGRLLARTRLNLLSTDRIDRLAKSLEERTRHRDLDWREKLPLAVTWALDVYRIGEPAILLRDVADPDRTADLLEQLVCGSGVTIFFGDGGTLKSYLAMWTAATLHELERARVLYLDWEDEDWVHKQRLQRLGPEMPDLLYRRMVGSLKDGLDPVRHIVRDEGIGAVVVDSIAPACGGEPESAEIAVSFFEAARRLGVPVIATAHNTKIGGDDKPFGSTFWHNLARRTWFVKKVQELGAAGVSIGLFCRKNNLGPLYAPIGYRVEFGEDRTTFTRHEVADVIDLAKELPVKHRIASLLRTGALPIHEIADALEVSVESVRIALKRGKDRQFVLFDSVDRVERWGLKA